MTQLPQALTLLGVSTDSSNEERKIAFESKRDKLEAQTVQSPTPALKEKFRTKLKELEQAYQLIEQELASDELPVAAPVNINSNQTQGSFQQNLGQQSNNQQNSDFAAEHHWKLQIMEELDERFGKTLNSSQLQGYLASCAPQQNLDTLIPLALDKIKKYGKEPLDNEYYKQAKWLQNTLFTLFVANRKDHPAFRELLHQEAISGIEALALLCAEKKHFVTPTQQETLQLKRQKIKRAFPKVVVLSVFVISGVIAQPYVSQYIDGRNSVEQLIAEASKLIQLNYFNDAKIKLNKAKEIGILLDEVKEQERRLAEKISKTPIYGISKNDWYVSRAKSEGKQDWSGVDIKGNTVTIRQDKTDNGPNLLSKAIPVLEGKTLRIFRKVKLHSEVTRTYQSGNEFFTGELSVFEAASSISGYIRKDRLRKLCQIRYYNYEYQGDWDTFFVQDNISKNYVNSTWDEPFTEELFYTPKSGMAIYKKGKETVRAQCEPNKENFIRIHMHSYGWWTGHYTKIYDMSVSWVD